MVSYDHEPPAQQHHSSSGDPFIFGRRSMIMGQPSSSSTSSSSMPVGYQARHHQQNQPPRDEQPRPYQGPSAPFPLPTNKRSLGGLAALDEHEGANVMKSLFGEGRAQPAPLGKTRCYWALLSYHSSSDNPYDMTFVYCDPVLQSHLGTEADHMLGKSFFDFVHPSEKDRAKDDLQNIVSSRTLFGSVTRCRYWRVPAIRKFFGNPNPPIAPESHMYVEDDLYLPIDVVLNMVGDSLALCFFHAIINKSIMDNSETDKTDWTNWCGTARELFDIEQCNKLWSSVVAQQLNKRRQDEPAAPPYVFQILSMPHAPTAAPGSLSPSSARPNESPEILFSWPPPRLYRQEAAVGSRRDEEHFHQAFEDGSYFADDFAGLAVNVQASPSARTEDGSTARNGDPGTIQDGTNTSCTRRFRAKHTLTSEGMLRAVESVLVPYGSIMFACFSTTYQQTIQHQQNRSTPSWAHHTDHALTQTPQSLSIGADGPPRKKTRDIHHSPPVPSTSSLQTPSHWMPAGNSGSVHDAEGSSYFPHSHLPRLHGHGHSTDASTSSADQQPAERPYWPRPPSPDTDSKDGVLAQVPTSSSNSRPMEIDLANSTDPVIMQATAAASLFAEINPETGEKRCTSCGTSNSPEWRKGPTGQKTLCNACGLRFSRSINRQSKKEEKARKQAAAQQAAIDVLEGRAVMKQKQPGKGAGGTNTSMSLPAAQALYAQQALAGEQPFYTGIAQARPSEPSAREGAGGAGSGHQQRHSHDGTMPPHGHHDARAATAHHSHPSVTHHHEHQHQGPYMLHHGPPPALSHAHQQPHQHNQQHQQPMNGFGMAPHSQGHGPLHPPFRPY